MPATLKTILKRLRADGGTVVVVEDEGRASWTRRIERTGPPARLLRGGVVAFEGLGFSPRGMYVRDLF